MVPFLFSLSFHEFAHAWTANRFGDPTARLLGRMTLNPVVHIHPIGTVLFPILSFFTGVPFIGWANPVPVNERALTRPLQHGTWVALAGPASNFLLSVVFAGVLFLVVKVLPLGNVTPLVMMLMIAVKVNVWLGLFNLLPVPPLDGGRIIYGFFPGLHDALDWFGRYGFIVIFALFYTGILGNFLAVPANFMIQNLLGWVM